MTGSGCITLAHALVRYLQHSYCAIYPGVRTLCKLSFFGFYAGAVAGLVSHLLNARLGRKWCMVIAGFWFTVGAAINAGARDLAMLYIGRVLLGFGVGFANQSVSTLTLSLSFCFMLLDYCSTSAHYCMLLSQCTHTICN